MAGMVLRIGTLLVVALAANAMVAAAQNTTTRVSLSGAEDQANSASLGPAISADGRFIAFYSLASNLVPGDSNGYPDIFVRDRVLGSTVRASVSSTEAQANGGSARASISADGRFVAFHSDANNLVNDTNAARDVFVRDVQEGVTTRVSVSSTGSQATGGSSSPFISADGRYVLFSSSAPNLVPNDTNNASDVFRHDRLTGATIRVSLGPIPFIGGVPVQGNDSSYAAGISADGRLALMSSDASNLVPNDTNGRADVFVRNIDGNGTARVSVGAGGAQADHVSDAGNISADGRYVVFQSLATNLVPNGAPGTYVHDLQTRVTSLISTNTDGTLSAAQARISADGSSICYAQLLPGGKSELMMIDRSTLRKIRVDVASDGTPANFASEACAPSADATFVAFESIATNLVEGDTNTNNDVFVRSTFTTAALDKTALRFTAVTAGNSFLSQTGTQTVRLVQSGIRSMGWTAASNQPWLQVSPASGVGSGVLSISVAPSAGMPPQGTLSGTIVVSLTGDVNAVPPIAVTLTLTPAGTTLVPFGTVDTPTDNRTGVTGAVPFTGWALDDVGVTRVSICRAAFVGEVAPVDANCAGAAEVFVGFAVFIDGARPDVMAAFPSFPQALRGGWGFMVLTNMLPAGGNGTYRFTMRAQDVEGNWTVLGVRTMTCANVTATLPFGNIDTPAQGGTASGSGFVNFGWALTPLPKTIPADGSTIQVLVDGVSVGTADYGHPRSDIQALFPGFNNTDGAVGFRILDTTLLSNGLHTISWVVTDNLGATEGIGSRFFSVSNGVAAATAAATASPDLDALPQETTPIPGRRGWDLEAPFGLFGAGARGVTVVRSEEVSRVELRLGDGDHSAYLRTPSGFAPLPTGSRLDRATSTFTWAPGPGFVGAYDFVFVRHANGAGASRRDVRIILQPKSRGAVGPQVAIDAPRAGAHVGQPFMLGGWAVDLDAAAGTGVTTLHAWAYPASGGAPVFLGATAYGGARPDVAAVHGDQFMDSGFGLNVQGLPAGDYDLALYAWSTEVMNFVVPKIVRVTIAP